MKLYIVEEGKLVEYERFGECLQCGECCRKKITFEWEVAKPGVDKECDLEPEDWIEYEGWSIIYVYGVYWYYKVTEIGDKDQDPGCPDFVDGLCKEHDDLFSRKAICFLWPFNPKDLLPGCGYRFERCKS